MPLGIYGWVLLVAVLVGMSYFYRKEAKKGWAESILHVIYSLGTVLIALIGIVIASHMGDQEKKARAREVTPKIFISSVEYAEKDVDKTHPPKHILVSIKNMGEGDATDLWVALERCDPKEKDIKKRKFANPCLRIVPGEETFSIDQLRYLSKGEPRRIPFDISELYSPEETDASQDSFYWQKQRFKAYVWYKNVENDSFLVSRPVSIASSVAGGHELEDKIKNNPNLWHPDNDLHWRFREMK